MTPDSLPFVHQHYLIDRRTFFLLLIEQLLKDKYIFTFHDCCADSFVWKAWSCSRSSKVNSLVSAGGYHSTLHLCEVQPGDKGEGGSDYWYSCMKCKHQAGGWSDWPNKTVQWVIEVLQSIFKLLLLSINSELFYEPQQRSWCCRSVSLRVRIIPVFCFVVRQCLLIISCSILVTD